MDLLKTRNFFKPPTQIALVYPPNTGSYTNVLLIDNSVKDAKIFSDSVNSSTFPIIYSNTSTKTELLALLEANFTTIDRIGFVFASNIAIINKFLDGKPFFSKEDLLTNPYSENVEFLVSVLKEFNVKNIDFLACDTLNYPDWVNYYSVLQKETGVKVGASNDKTGNIKYGGDWIMENTSQDIENCYFTKNIEYYKFLLDTWTPSPNPFPTGISYATSVVNNNYVYVIGGQSYGSVTDTVYYAYLNPNGSVDTWNPTTPLPTSIFGMASIVNNNFVYVFGGYTGSMSTNTVYYAPLNPDGSVGSWIPTTALTESTCFEGAVVNNGYVYVIGGFNGSTSINTVYYAQLNPDGSVGSWIQTTSILNYINSATSIVNNNYVYVIGGGVDYATKLDTVYYAHLNPDDGSVGSWFTTTILPIPILSAASIVNNDYVYVIGGSTNPDPDTGISKLDTVYYAQLNTNGTIDSWNLSSISPFQFALDNHTSVVNNNYIYTIGGIDSGSNSLNTVYYIASPFPYTPPEPTTLWYSIKITLPSNNEIFNGYFSVLQANPSDTSGVVTNFYNLSNYGVDIFTDNSYAGADSVFLINTNEFSTGGTLITSFPYFKIRYSNSVYYDLYQDGTGGVKVLGTDGSELQTVEVIFTITQIPEPPPPPTTLLYSTKITLPGDIEIFNGVFTVYRANPSDTQGFVTHFYDASNGDTDIYINNRYYDANSVFYININRFSDDGTIINSFPYFKNTYRDAVYYDLWSSDKVSPINKNGEILEDVDVIITNTLIYESPSLLYSTKINLTNNTKIFNGFFSVLQADPLDTQGLVTHFYDLTKPSDDIFIDNGYDGADAVFSIPEKQFSENGTSINSFPYFKKKYDASGAVFYDLWRYTSGEVVGDTVDIIAENGDFIENEDVKITNTLISGPPLPATIWYSIKIKLAIGNNEIFNGYFSVLFTNPSDNQALVTHFYNLTNYGVDISIDNGFYYADNGFLIGDNEFTIGGNVITSFPYFKNLYKNEGAAFYNLYREEGDDWVGVRDVNDSGIANVQVTFTITQISEPPPPPPPIKNYLSMHSLFTNNAMVYYKKNSLAPCGVGSVSNSRSKSRKT